MSEVIPKDSTLLKKVEPIKVLCPSCNLILAKLNQNILAVKSQKFYGEFKFAGALTYRTICRGCDQVREFSFLPT